MSRLDAPWTHEQVDNLNANQRRHPPLWHEFTCSEPHTGFDRTLVATVNGWICPHCDYRQSWCHAVMAERIPVEWPRQPTVKPHDPEGIDR